MNLQQKSVDKNFPVSRKSGLTLCNHNVKALTLIELMMVLVIGLIVAGISGGIFGRFFMQSETDNTQRLISANLKKAHAYSVSGKYLNPWGVKLTGTTLTLYAGSNYASRNTALDQITEINNNVLITGLNEINFSKTSGIPTTSGTITISAENNVKTIVVSNLGLVSIQ